MTDTPRLHAILLPGPGLGHINGSISLALSLHRVGFSVTLVCFSTAFHYHSKSNRIRPMPSYINLHVLSDGDNNDSATCYYELFVIRDSMQKQLMDFMEDLLQKTGGGCCIIPDVFMGPVAHPVAEKLQLPRVDYVPSNATAYLQILALPDLLAQGYFNDDEDADEPFISDHIDIKGLVRLPRNELLKIPVPLIQRYIMPGVLSTRGAERVLVHSTYEIESAEFDNLRKAYGIHAVAVGPLLDDPADVEETRGSRDACLTWLDSQPASSVVYVSFGSNVALTRNEAAELALGLEDSGRPFVWVIRPEDAVNGREDISDVLPPGFLDRVQARAKIIPWAPQPDVLAHPAVGGFLSHCGWNSTIEAVWNGVPILTCPRAAEQYTNARFISREWRCGVALKALERGDVRDGVKALMSDQDVRFKAHDLKALVRKAVAPGGSSHCNLVQFARDMSVHASHSIGQS